MAQNKHHDHEDKMILDLDLYGLLDLKQQSTDKDIKRRYKEIARLTHPDKLGLNQNNEGVANNFIKANHAYHFLINPTTRMIYDAFGHSGLEAYENYLEAYESLEREHKIIIESGGDASEIEQQIFDKTTLLISENVKSRIHSEYSLNTNFELGFDFENFWNYYYEYQKHNRDDAFQLIEYRQAIMSSSFKIPIASWISGDISVQTQADMRRNLGVSKLTYTNTMELAKGIEVSNAVNFGSNDMSIDNVLSVELFNGKIDVDASFQINKYGCTKPSFSAKTNLTQNTDLKFGLDLDDGTYTTTMNTKFGRYSVGLTTKIGDRLLSLSPHIGFKISDDTNFSANWSLAKK